ncbi:hypothetical protein GHT87_04055 [Acinetobacter baumannii]|uniref:hypothetical protein n=1 Tax=Acinetobacter baumannii TaxID=470 RepID=UPI001EEED07C|nr:hypothetical protein [Acinetobacter baumannii]MCG6649629.1 hypothetical protein [Acinetobacter baumannii]
MKPEQFIREYGVDKARDLLDQLHKLGCPDDMKITVINGMWQRTSNGFTYPELKRLVESVEIIQFWHGIEWCKGLVEDYKEEPIHKESYGHRIIQAIADYESIYGGGDE